MDSEGRFVLTSDLPGGTHVRVHVGNLRNRHGYQPENGWEIQNRHQAMAAGYEGEVPKRSAYRIIRISH